MDVGRGNAWGVYSEDDDKSTWVDFVGCGLSTKYWCWFTSLLVVDSRIIEGN